VCDECIVDVDQAVNVFSQLQQVDPYRLDNMDTYSNLLYVKVCYFDYCTILFFPMVLSHCWLGDSKDIQPLKARATYRQRFSLEQVDEETKGNW